MGTGVNIIGGLTSEDELPTVGTPGDAYMIGGDLYVWQDDTGSWKNVGPIQGPEGKSAYDLAVETGFEGTLEEWIESLQGEIGPRGPEGPQGPPGQDADLTEITEQLDQLEQTTENHINNNDKHFQIGEREQYKNYRDIYGLGADAMAVVSDFNLITKSGFYHPYDSEGANPHQEISDLKYVDLPFGFINYDTHYIGSIDKDGELIIKMKELTPIELENAKLREDIILL